MTFVALVAVALVVAAGLSWRLSFPSPRPRANWLTVAWPAVILGPALQFTRTRDPLAAAQGDVAVENYLEVVVLLIIGVWAVTQLWDRPGWWRIRGPLIGFAAYAWLAMASGLWSMTPLISFTRGLEVLCLLALTEYTRVRLVEEGRAEPVLGGAVRLYLFLLVGFVAWGAARPSAWLYGRFTWPGTHPLAVGVLVVVALVFLVGAGRDLGRMTRFTRFALTATFGSVLFFTLGRSPALGLGLAVVVMLFASRHRLARREWVLAGAGVVLVVIAGAAVSQVDFSRFATHQESGNQILTLTGRIPLWDFALRETIDDNHWLLGYGHDAGRTIVFPLFHFAGGSHNSWVQAFLDLGLVGLLTFGASTYAITRRVLRSARDGCDGMTRCAGGLVMAMLVASLAAEGLVFVTPMMGAFFFAAAVVAAELPPRESRTPATEMEDTPVAPALRA